MAFLNIPGLPNSIRKFIEWVEASVFLVAAIVVIGGALVGGVLGVVGLIDDEPLGWQITFFVGLAFLWVFIVLFFSPLVRRAYRRLGGQPAETTNPGNAIDTQLGDLEGRITATEKDTARWERLETTVNNLQGDFIGYKETMKGGFGLKDDQRLTTLETRITEIEQTRGPQPSFDAEAERSKIVIHYQQAGFSLGDIDRSIVFSFRVYNFSSLSISPTRQTHGVLSFESSDMFNTQWNVHSGSPHINSGSKGDLNILVSVSDRLAESIAFKADQVNMHIDFSDMKVEFKGKDVDGIEAILGFVELGGEKEIVVRDGQELKTIRAFVNWRESLTEEESASD